jgi:hypothetical protein
MKPRRRIEIAVERTQRTQTTQRCCTKKMNEWNEEGTIIAEVVLCAQNAKHELQQLLT